MLKLALLVLTFNPEGELRMTLSDKASLEECQASKAQIEPVLKGAGYTVLSLLCGETDLRLTPYKDVKRRDPLTRYRVQLMGNDGFVVAPLSKGESCTASPNGRDPVFCALSGQKVIAQGPTEVDAPAPE
ncbi:hypothetical protein [Aliiroseovarius crassostreae]|uniref:hypothetical protein n=1 Tax=Aliiroseovarius crassostreae TaxID=154981 RepID=UPI003C7E98C3